MTRRHGRFAGGGEHKLQQLCSQVEQVVGLALGGAADMRLQEVAVCGVVPAPDGTRLLVSVVPEQPSSWEQLEALQVALERAKPWLRQQVAGEIHRKRTPDLVFSVLPYRTSSTRPP